MTTYSQTHEGLTRMIEGSEILRQQIGPVRGMRALPVVVLTGMVTAVLAVLDRVFDLLSFHGVTAEWMALWMIAFVAAMACGKLAFATARGVRRAARSAGALWRRMREEDVMHDLIAADPRMATELRVARDHAAQD